MKPASADRQPLPDHGGVSGVGGVVVIRAVNATTIPWLKHWRSGTSTPPRRYPSRALARFALDRARGPGIQAARGRLAYHVNTPPASTPVEIVAYTRESGDHGYWNRRWRRALQERVARTLDTNSTTERKHVSADGVL